MIWLFYRMICETRIKPGNGFCSRDGLTAKTKSLTHPLSLSLHSIILLCGLTFILFSPGKTVRVVGNRQGLHISLVSWIMPYINLVRICKIGRVDFVHGRNVLLVCRVMPMISPLTWHRHMLPSRRKNNLTRTFIFMLKVSRRLLRNGSFALSYT